MDHLVLGVPDLTQGMDLVERQTGVRARFGGQHPGRGTHNALMSLGGRQYLEIIAVDPDQSDASGLLFPELKGLSEPRFIGWAVAVDSIDDVAKRARAANLSVVGPLDGSRAQSDGRLLTWKTLRVASPTLELIPFFIAWHKNTPHPSQSAPSGCRLTSFRIEHAQPEPMRKALSDLGVEADIVAGSRVRLTARLRTPKGDVELG